MVDDASRASRDRPVSCVGTAFCCSDRRQVCCVSQHIPDQTLRVHGLVPLAWQGKLFAPPGFVSSCCLLRLYREEHRPLTGMSVPISFSRFSSNDGCCRQRHEGQLPLQCPGAVPRQCSDVLTGKNLTTVKVLARWAFASLIAVPIAHARFLCYGRPFVISFCSGVCTQLDGLLPCSRLFSLCASVCRSSSLAAGRKSSPQPQGFVFHRWQ